MNIGDITFTARTTPGPGCIVADGSAVSRTTYAGLFAAIGTTYGSGDGASTFNVPDCRGRVIAGINGATERLKNRFPGGVDADLVGATGGEEGHTLSSPLGEAPVDGQLIPGSGISSGDDYSDSCSLNEAGQPHNNIPPCIVLLPVIYTGV